MKTAMTPLDGALEMVAMGFAVFPLRPGSKDEHLSKSWKAAATADAARVQVLAKRYPNCNWGMRCAGHMVIDVDVTDGKQGEASFLRLEIEHELPRTRTHFSARGGRHVILRMPAGVEATNRDKPLGENSGLNVRGAGGYVVCPGSTFEGKPYGIADASPIMEAPASLVTLLQAPPPKRGAVLPDEYQDNQADVARAASWLDRRPVVQQGARGTEIYKAAARVRDWGLTEDTALHLIAEHFAARMEPPEGVDFCAHEVGSAFKHAQNTAGVAATAADFDDVSTLVAELTAGAVDAAPVQLGNSLKWPAVKVDKDDNVTIVAKAIDNVRAHLAFTGTTIWHDEFAGKDCVRSAHFNFTGELTDARLNHVRLDAFKRGLACPPDHYGAVISDLAFQAKRHPVREYLDALKWDGVPRLNKLFSRYTGSPDTELNAAAGTLLMVAAVRRIRRPGEKFDYMVVLEGKQEAGKSGFVSVLSRGWHSENFDLGQGAKEIIEQTRGKWIIEVPELAGLETTRGREHVKALITRTHDEARAAYAKRPETVARQWVLIATTNDRRYLTDPTGNRRFLPIEAPKTDFAALKADLDQLWAEAAVAERTYGRLELPASVRPALKALQGDREAETPLRELIRCEYEWRPVGTYVVSTDVWRTARVPVDQCPTGHQGRAIAAEMRAIGYDQKRRVIAGGKVSGYERVDNPTGAALRDAAAPVSIFGHIAEAADALNAACSLLH